LENGLADPLVTYFCITDDLEGTVLISYTHRKNDFDTIFQDRRFNFRIEGGIYPGDKTQTVENEVFRDQRFNPNQIAAIPYEVQVLTIGSSTGVPQWVGKKINNIFSLSDVEVDGIKSVRNESSNPEIISTGIKWPLYVHKISIEQANGDTHTLIDYYEYLTDNQGSKIQDNNSNYIKVRR
jgi:hypothetical protein